MASYKPDNNRALSNYTLGDRLTNQVVLYGANPEQLVEGGIFCLEYLEVESGGTATIKDGDDNTICSGITILHCDKSPLRCDQGIKIEGDITIAKGFVLNRVFV